MTGTPIQWCDDTVNLVTGCAGCELFLPARSGCPNSFNDLIVSPGRTAATLKSDPPGGDKIPEADGETSQQHGVG